MTTSQLLTMVAARIEETKKKGETYDSGMDDPLKAACWFIACQEASCFLDGVRTKDLASYIVDGRKIDGPYRTRKDVDYWVEVWNDNQTELGQVESMPAAETAEMGRLLDQHFGLRRGA